MEIEVKFKFQPILKLEIWHDYYLGKPNNLSSLPAGYDISEAIALIPTQECQKTLRNLRWLFRPQSYGAVLLAHVDTRAEGLTPIVPIDKNVRLTFWMELRDSNFSNYTNLPLESSRNYIYYFSNLSDNPPTASTKKRSAIKESSLFLTQPLNQYSKDSTYAMGDIVTHSRRGGKSITLEAATSRPKNLTTQMVTSLEKESEKGALSSVARDWLLLPGSQYVSGQDRHPCQGLGCTETLVRASPGDTVRLVDQNEQDTVLFQVPSDHPPETDLKVSLNFIEQLPGRYKLRYESTTMEQDIQGIDKDFILMEPIAGRQAFALVELVLNSRHVPTHFRVLDSTDEVQQLHSKTYRIHFRNRATRWRYHIDRAPRDRGSKERKSADTLRDYFNQLPDYFEYNIDQEQSLDRRTFTFTTKSPFGHYRSPPKLLVDGDSHSLPAPSPATIPSIAFDPPNSRNIKALFSDIYL